MKKKLNPQLLGLLKAVALIAGGSFGTYLATAVPDVYAAVCLGA